MTGEQVAVERLAVFLESYFGSYLGVAQAEARRWIDEYGGFIECGPCQLSEPHAATLCLCEHGHGCLWCELARVRVEVRAETLREVREATAEWLELADDATEGPWTLGEQDDEYDVPVLMPSGNPLCISPDDGVRGGHDIGDAKLIAASRAAADRLAALVSVSPVAGEDNGDE